MKVSGLRYDFSLRAKLTASFLFMVAILLGLLAINSNTSRIALINEANQTLFAAASHTAATLDAFIDFQLDDIETAAQFPELKHFLMMTPEERKGYNLETLLVLGRRQGNQFGVLSYALLDKNGINIADSVPSYVGTDESNRDYFRKPLETGLSYVSPVEFADQVGGANIHFSAPIRQELGGAVLGIVRMRYNVSTIQQIVFQSKGLAGNNSHAILLDENFIRLADDVHPDLVFKSVIPLPDDLIERLRANHRLPNRPNDQLSTELTAFAEGLANAAENPFFAAPIRTSNVVDHAAIAKLEKQPWLVVYSVPEHVFLSPINTQMHRIVILGILLGIGAIAAGMLAAHGFTAPINRLTKTVEKISAGDLTVRAQIEGRDEIGLLAHAFNAMTSRLQTTLQTLEQQVIRLAQVNINLESQIEERQRAEEKLKEAQNLLEKRVKERTVDLFTTNVRLQQEVTERQQAEESLRESEEKFRSVVEQSYDGVLLINKEGRVVEWNHGFAEITGLKREQVLNRFIWDVQYGLMPDTKKTSQIRQIFEEKARLFLSGESHSSGPSIEQEIDIQRPDGSIRSISSLTFRIETSQAMLGCTIARDVTEQRRAKEREVALTVERERSRVLTEFIQVASHEFRTPLSIINLKVHLLNQAGTSQHKDEYLDSIREQSENILTLVEALVMMSRLDAGVIFEREDYDLNDFVRQIYATMQPVFERKIITTTLETQENLPRIIGDSEELNQAFSNILNNAVRYTPEGGSIHLRTYETDHQVIFEISDTGIGIDEDHLPHIFDRFYRVDRAHSTRGFGLGLTIAKKIIDGHDGQIEIESKPGSGTIVKVRLPSAPRK